jgi:hypothetical protein
MKQISTKPITFINGCVGYLTTLKYLDYIASDGRMIDELERIWKKAVMAYSRYYPGILLEGLRNTAENLSPDGWDPARDSNDIPPDYEARTLPLDPPVQYMLLTFSYIIY